MFTVISGSTITYLLSKQNKTSVKLDILRQLPQELVQQILFDLSSEDLYSTIFCCSSWNVAVRSDAFWKRLCQRDGYTEVEESQRSEFYNSFLKKYNYWQGVYWYNYTLQLNWETNNYKEVTYKIKDGLHIRWRCYDDQIATMVSSNLYCKKLYRYDLKNKELKETVLLSTSCNLRSDGIILRSGNYWIHFFPFKVLLVWDIVDGSAVIDESWNHEIPTNIKVNENLIVLIVGDKLKFEVFDMKTAQIEYEFGASFENLTLMDGRILFSTLDNVIHVLTWHDKSLETFTCCKDQLCYKLLVKNDRLLIFCHKDYDNITVCVWNISTKTKLHSTLFTKEYDLVHSSFIRKYLYVTKFDSSIKDYVIELWDYTNNRTLELWDYGIMGLKGISKCLMSFKPPYVCFETRQYLPSIYLTNDNFIVINAPLCKLRVWCLRTRRFLYHFDKNFLHKDYYYEIGITKTKLTYSAISNTGKTDDSVHLLYIRDYEISNKNVIPSFF